MFAIKTVAGDVSLTVQSAVRANTAKSLKTTDGAKVDEQNALREYVALQYASDAIDADLSKRAHAALCDVKTVDALKACRAAFVEAYNREYSARFPKNTAEQQTGARDVAWSRLIKRAETCEGSTWKKPVQTPKKPKAGKPGKPATHGNAGKPSNNAGKGKNQAKKAESAVEVMQSAIVEMKKFDTELSVALDWVRASGDNRTAFLEWFKAQKAAQLAPVAKAA